MSYNRIQVPGDSERPVPVAYFMSRGYPGQNHTAIVSYDEIYTMVHGTSRAMLPFLPEIGLPIGTQDEDLVIVRAKAKDIRHLQAIFKNIRYER